MVAHIEERGGKLIVRLLVSRAAGMFTAEIPRSATPMEMEIFCVELKTIVARRRGEPPNEAG